MNNDLISREALKKALKSNCDLCHDKNTNWCEHCCPLNDFEDLIDNAPTVEPCLSFNNVSDEDIEKFKLIWQRATSKGLRLINERPQGEWIAREDFDFLDENKVRHNHFMCEKCGFIHDFIDGHTSQYNFCPQCGADLKGGVE